MEQLARIYHVITESVIAFDDAAETLEISPDLLRELRITPDELGRVGNDIRDIQQRVCDCKAGLARQIKNRMSMEATPKSPPTHGSASSGQAPILPKGPPPFRSLQFVGSQNQDKSFDLDEDWARAEEAARASGPFTFESNLLAEKKNPCVGALRGRVFGHEPSLRGVEAWTTSSEPCGLVRRLLVF